MTGKKISLKSCSKLNLDVLDVKSSAEYQTILAEIEDRMNELKNNANDDENISEEAEDVPVEKIANIIPKDMQGVQRGYIIWRTNILRRMLNLIITDVNVLAMPSLVIPRN